MSINTVFRAPTASDLTRPAESTKMEKPAPMTIGATSAAAIISGAKTTSIIPITSEPHMAHVQVDDLLVFEVSHRNRSGRRRLTVTVTRLCQHEHLADIPACPHPHDPATITPHQPTWAHCLSYAAGRGRNKLSGKQASQLAAQGWAVVSFRLEP